MRDVKCGQQVICIFCQVLCLNYAGCKALTVIIYITLNIMLCLNYAGCKGVCVSVYERDFACYALTMRDVKRGARVTPLDNNKGCYALTMRDVKQAQFEAGVWLIRVMP